MMDGKTFPLSREFFGHVMDRCTPVPVTKSWEDILGPLGIDTSDIPDTRPNIESGESWFNRQNEDIQRHILGKSAYGLWKDPSNNVTLKSFVGLKHDKDWGSSVRVRSVKDILKKSVDDFEEEQKAIQQKIDDDAKRKAEELKARKEEERTGRRRRGSRQRNGPPKKKPDERPPKILLFVLLPI
jgi:hypothetical protein